MSNVLPYSYYHINYSVRNIVRGFFHNLFNYDDLFMKWTEQNAVIKKTTSTKNSPYMTVNLFFLWSATHLEPVDPVSCAALTNAMQPSSPIYHVSNRRVNYITQLSLFNDGGGHRGGIGLQIGRNLRAKPRLPSVCQNRTVSQRSLSSAAPAY